MSILQNSEKLVCNSCNDGSASIVIKVVTHFIILFSMLKELLAVDSSTLIEKVQKTLINSITKNTPVKIGFLGLLII